MSLLRVNQINFFCQYLSINLVARSCGKSLQFRIELHPHPFKVFAFPSTNNHILVTEKCLVPIPWGHCVKQIIVMLSPQQSLIHMVHLGFIVLSPQHNLLSNSYLVPTNDLLRIA